MAITKDDAIKSKIRKDNSKLKNAAKPAFDKSKYEKRDLIQEVADDFIARGEKAQKTEWIEPWFVFNHAPFNIETGKPFSGINKLTLAAKQYIDPRFGTLLQFNSVCEKLEIECKHEGLKGTGTNIFKRLELIKADKDGNRKEWDDPTLKKEDIFIAMKRVGTAFNATHFPGITPWVAPKPDFEPHAEVELLVKAMEAKGLTIVHGKQTKACYSPGKHEVFMPERSLFKTPADYYSTLLHELGHSTSKELDRPMTGDMKTKQYCFEELVAEITSHFLGANFGGIAYSSSTHENSAMYCNEWLKMMKEDKSVIFKAAAKAEKASTYLMTTLHEYKMDMGLIPRVEKVQEEKSPVIAPVLTKKEPALSMSM